MVGTAVSDNGTPGGVVVRLVLSGQIVYKPPRWTDADANDDANDVSSMGERNEHHGSCTRHDTTRRTCDVF